MVLRTASFHSRFFSVLIPPASFRVFCLFLTWGRGWHLDCFPTRDEYFLVKCRLLGFAFCLNSPDGPLPSGWPSSSLAVPRLALPSGLQKPHLPGLGHAHLLAPLFIPRDTRFFFTGCFWFQVHRCRFASFPPPSLHPGFSWRWGRNLRVGPGCRAVAGRTPHSCAGGLRVGTGSGSSSRWPLV